MDDRTAVESYMNSILLSQKHLHFFLSHLSKIIGAAHEELAEIPPQRSGRPRLMWKYNFVAVISKLWFDLTGRKPSRNPSSIFIRFVDAAWISAGDDMPEVHWEDTIREYCQGPRAKREQNTPGD